MKPDFDWQNFSKALEPAMEAMRDVGNLIVEINEDPDFQKLVGWIKLKQSLKNQQVLALMLISDNEIALVGNKDTSFINLETYLITTMSNQEIETELDELSIINN